MTLVECNIIRQECGYVENLIKDKPEKYVTAVLRGTRQIRQWCDEIEEVFDDVEKEMKK